MSVTYTVGPFGDSIQPRGGLMAKIRVTSAPARDPESGGPALTEGKEYEAKLMKPLADAVSQRAVVLDDEGYPVMLGPENYEIVEEDT